MRGMLRQDGRFSANRGSGPFPSAEATVTSDTNIRSAIDDPLDYPFEMWRHCFALADGTASKIPLGSLPLEDVRSVGVTFERIKAAGASARIRRALEIEQPVALFSCGSNASPRRLAEKLRRSAHSNAVAIRVSTRAFTPCYTATLSYYGSIPATFATTGELSYPFLVITDARNLPTMVQSETRTGNYDLYRAAKSNASILLDIPVYAFLSRFGALRLDGREQSLQEFQDDERGLGVSQRTLIERVLKALDYKLSLDAYRDRLRDATFRDQFREAIIARFQRPVEVAGFEKIA